MRKYLLAHTILGLGFEAAQGNADGGAVLLSQTPPYSAMVWQAMWAIDMLGTVHRRLLEDDVEGLEADFGSGEYAKGGMLVFDCLHGPGGPAVSRQAGSYAGPGDGRDMRWTALFLYSYHNRGSPLSFGGC